MFRTIFILTLFISFGCEEPSSKKTKATSENTKVPTSSNENDFLDQEENIISQQDRIDKFTTKPPTDDHYIPIGTFRSQRPSSWIWQPPKTQIIFCNYIAPSIDENEHATFTATIFSEGTGGHFTDNVTRWKGMFKTNGGAPIKPLFDVVQANGHDAVIAEFEGEYMGAGGSWHLRDYKMIVVEIREPKLNIYLKLLGPSKTVDAHKTHFLNVVNTFESTPNTEFN